MKPPRPAAFLERRAYRRRRLADAARMLPVLGLVLFLVPVLWPAAETGGPGTGRGGLYLFAAWAGLILAAALIARPLSRGDRDEVDADGGEDPR